MNPNACTEFSDRSLDAFREAERQGVREMMKKTPSCVNVSGRKDDNGKIRPGLLFEGMPRALKAVAEVATYGAEKYDDHNWLTVEDGATRYRDALYRHLLDDRLGSPDDPESGLPHLAHAAWNALAILELYLKAQDNE